MGELLAAGALLALAYLWVLSQPEPAQPRRLQMVEPWTDPYDPDGAEQGSAPLDRNPDDDKWTTICPKGHANAHVRLKDGAIWCRRCDGAYYPTAEAA